MPPAFLGEVLEARRGTGGQALRQPERGEPVVGIDGVADVAAESGMGLLWPGAVPAGEFDQRIAVALVFRPDDGAQQDIEAVGVVALVGGGERAGVGEFDPAGPCCGIVGGAADPVTREGPLIVASPAPRGSGVSS